MTGNEDTSSLMLTQAALLFLPASTLDAELTDAIIWHAAKKMVSINLLSKSQQVTLTVT